MENDRLINLANRKKNQERLAPGSSAGPREVRPGEGKTQNQSENIFWEEIPSKLAHHSTDSTEPRFSNLEKGRLISHTKQGLSSSFYWKVFISLPIDSFVGAKTLGHIASIGVCHAADYGHRLSDAWP